MERKNVYVELLKLSLPIMGTSLIQMSYNIMDMFWLGKISEEAVTSAGITGYVVWVGFAITMMCKVGAEVGIGQSVGRKNKEETQDFINNSIGLGLIISLFFLFLVILFRFQILGFFRADTPSHQKMSMEYLLIVMAASPMNYLNTIFTGIYHGFGNSKITFKINTIGIFVNMILDPLLIFGFHLGVKGAALATAMAQMTIFFIYIGVSRKRPYAKACAPFRGLKKERIRRIFRWGIPISLHSIIFAGMSSILARLTASYGNYAFAAHQIGVQIESIGWLTFTGLSTSIGVFIAQHYGAKDRVGLLEGVKKGTILSTIFGLLIGLILYFSSDTVFRLFINQEETVRLGVAYLKVMSIAQIFAAWEASAMGFLNGIGKTAYPSATGVIGNLARVPLGYGLSYFFGVVGIWWAVAGSCMIKGSLPQMFVIYFRRKIAGGEEVYE